MTTRYPEMYPVAEAEFQTMGDLYDRLFTGWYAMVLWEYSAPNAIWITGPYPTKERAEVDARYFSESDNYPNMKTYRVVGSDPPEGSPT